MTIVFRRRSKIGRKKVSKTTEAYGLLKTSLKYQTKEFFENSTLHGVRYIAEKGRPFGEKFIWFCLVSIGAVAAFVIIGSLWEKFQTNPTITGLDTDFHNQQVFFPTVTVCPKIAYSPSLSNGSASFGKSEAMTLARNESDSESGGGGDYAESEDGSNMSGNTTTTASTTVSEEGGSGGYDNETTSDGVENNNDNSNKEEEDYYQQFMKAMPALSYDIFGSIHDAAMNLSEREDMRDKNLRQLAFQVGIKCDELLEICKYKDEEITCCEYFMPLYSEHGLCYSFNSRYYSTPENEIKNEKINNLFETDKKWALTFVPTASSKVFVHSIDEITGYDFRPTFSHDIGHAVTLLISMKQTYTTDDARQLSIGQRKCIFPDEKRLKYYKDDVYSFSQCMRQCRIERSHFFCSCVAPFYHMPPTTSEGIKNYRHCGIEDFSCLLKFHHNITDIRMCKHCELSCLNTVYDIEKFSKVMVPESNKREDFHVSIEFLTWPIIRYKREVLFGWVDLLVSFGGIAGLFLGFSLLSGVEIIYYFTMRAGCMMYKNREELYSVQREKETRPKSQYDLGWMPKKSDRLQKSLPPIILTVRPVESAGSKSIEEVKAFESPKAPIKKQYLQLDVDKGNSAQINAINNKINEIAISRYMRRYGGGVGGIRRGKPLGIALPPASKIVFRPIQLAPYSREIKPLDKKFRIRQRSEVPGEVIFDGYLA